jgi:small subunit ribosomal protein S2
MGGNVAIVTTRQLLEAGVHFGHQTRRWNPKMRRFILGERNGIYIIDLRLTLKGIEESYSYVRDLVSRGGVVLFVGTKKQTQGPVATYAKACGMPYVNERWLGGMLTNFTTISARVRKLQEYEAMEVAGDFDAMPKKEGLRHRRELDKLRRNLGGFVNLDHVPDAIFVIDTKKEHIAVTEANKLGMPVVAVVDTNCDPDQVTYVIPGNDDAIRSGSLMCRVIAEAVKEGRYVAANRPIDPRATAAATGGRDSGQRRRQPSVQRAQGQATAETPEAPAAAAASATTPEAAAPASEAPAPEAAAQETAAPEVSAPQAEAPQAEVPVVASPEPETAGPAPSGPAASGPAASRPAASGPAASGPTQSEVATPPVVAESETPQDDSPAVEQPASGDDPNEV